MLMVIPPAKMLDETPVKPPAATSAPVFQEAAQTLVDRLKKFSSDQIAELMTLSPELASLNHGRFREWAKAPLKPAILLFNGHVYQTLKATELDADDLRFAQRHLRILSGLYGLLRPMDLIAPHRLEMGTKLPLNNKVRDLYAFWGDRIGQELAQAVRKNRDTAVVNLASVEYAKAIRPGNLPVPMITPLFKEQTPKGLRTVAIHAKHQRGAMARWAIRYRVLDPADLKAYDADGYTYRPEGSTEREWLFVR